MMISRPLHGPKQSWTYGGRALKKWLRCWLKIGRNRMHKLPDDAVYRYSEYPYKFKMISKRNGKDTCRYFGDGKKYPHLYLPEHIAIAKSSQMTDIAGNEIFQTDILFNIKNRDTVAVAMGHDHLFYVLTPPYNENPEEKPNTLDETLKSCEWIIIGNIYTDPVVLAARKFALAGLAKNEGHHDRY